MHCVLIVYSLGATRELMMLMTTHVSSERPLRTHIPMHEVKTKNKSKFFVP